MRAGLAIRSGRFGTTTSTGIAITPRHCFLGLGARRRFHQPQLSSGGTTMSQRKVTRRSFIQGTTAAAAGAVVGTQPRSAVAKTTSPNSTLNVAAIGCGGMGFVDTMNLRAENVAALCDVDGRSSERAFSEFPKANRYRVAGADSPYRRFVRLHGGRSTRMCDGGP